MLDRRVVRRRFEERFTAARMAKDYVGVCSVSITKPDHGRDAVAGPRPFDEIRDLVEHSFCTSRFKRPEESLRRFVTESVGAKAANLARMAALGLPVPPAFVLPIELSTAILTALFA
jgi:hypothetical protein